MTIRIATPADLPRLRELMRGYYRDDGLTFTSMQADAMARLIAEAEWGWVHLLESNSAAIGYLAVCVGFSIELGGNDAFVDEVFVVPDHRGAGHGRRLVEAAAEEAARRRVCALHLEVDKGNTGAQRLYAALGFAKRDRYDIMTKVLQPAASA